MFILGLMNIHQLISIPRTIWTWVCSLKWTSHIESILSKAFARLNGIRRIGQVVSRVVRESLYNACTSSY